MSFLRYEEYEPEIQIQLQKEMNRLYLPLERREEIIRMWQSDRKTVFRQVLDWGERETSLTFSNAVTAVLAVMLFLGGWILTNRSDLFFQVHNEQFKQQPIIYVNVVKNQNGEIPLSEQGEMYVRKEYE